ncbi:PspC domain-containing protein [Shewanella sp. AS16]|uniref:PspC domain-containing protein n=1 Tax=Shewanella sp. AS16 TaxID=2907625 RepID=UPI001F41C0C6|nr:PspC domain-containing protein [Shewanella sp. AS16]MCE9687054.1 PspC domain-containing protein [Shewanella sp. AS16]
MKSLKKRFADEQRLVCGVAAGMATQFGWSCFWTRCAWLGALLINPGLSLLVYFVLALLVSDWKQRI